MNSHLEEFNQGICLIFSLFIQFYL